MCVSRDNTVVAVADFGSQVVALLSASTAAVLHMISKDHSRVERPIDVAELPDCTLLVADASGDCLVRVDPGGAPLSAITKVRGPCSMSIASLDEQVALVLREDGRKAHGKIQWLNLKPVL